MVHKASNLALQEQEPTGANLQTEIDLQTLALEKQTTDFSYWAKCDEDARFSEECQNPLGVQTL